MGEEASSFYNDGFSNLLHFGQKSKCNQTITSLGENIFVVEESGGGADPSFAIQIFQKSKSKWVFPTIIGTGPIPSGGHSTVALDGMRLLILKHNAPLDDCTWFLEVDTSFVKEKRKMLGTEVVAWSKGVQGDSYKPIVISGPSGVGKGTLISKLMKEFPSTFGFSVSHTTRHPRENEKDGVHYHFTAKSKMENDIREGKFLETASVHGNLYGTSIQAVEAVTESGKRCILDIDVQGARSVRASTLEADFIFIIPPSFEELERRLRLRGTEMEDQVQKRLRNAKTEIEQAENPGLFDHILVNDNLDLCYENLKKILGLNNIAGAVKEPCLMNKKLPMCHSISRRGQKLLIHCGTDEPISISKSLFVLDASVLSGGAPGSTRGFCIHETDILTDEPNGI